ncbi:MAG: recombinase family protein [Acholeplasmataceae bacterium]|nr:recombinase family protein [Acholeplasmataceae bacterium]MDD4468602.1 recombinase family protein [Acholeplasmataceae bacterium]
MNYFCFVYADERLSGASTNKRDQFNLMIELARLGKIDLILTKSISRFSRNTIDTLSILQELRTYNTEVFFEKENISSFDPKIEFVISVLASMAEEEARNISENVKWSVRKKFKKGDFYLHTKNLLGYKRDKNGEVYIDETEADIVRDIFKMYLDGIGSTTIARILTERGIKTIRGNTKWGTTGVIGILKNEKYAGAAMLQKTVNLDYKTSISSTNRNHLPKYYIENSHEGIISIQTYNEVQDKMNIKTPNQKKAIEKSLYSNHLTKYQGLCTCGQCGKYYRHKVNHSNLPYQRTILVCISNDSKKTCDNKSIFTHAFDRMIISQTDLLLKHKNDVLKTLETAFFKDEAFIALNESKSATEAKITALDEKLSALDVTNDEFNKLVAKELNEQIDELRVKLALINNELIVDYNFDLKMRNFKKLLIELKDLNGNYDDFDFKRLYSNVVINSRTNIIFNLNFRTIKHDKVLKEHLILPTSTTFIIRKTTIETFHKISI